GGAIGTSIDDLIAQPPGVGRDRLAQQLSAMTGDLSGLSPVEFKCRRRDGSTFDAACVATLTHVDSETHRLAVITDVTERRGLEREILEIAGREQLRIGSDLHDGLGQDLTGVALMLRSVVPQLRKYARDGARTRAGGRRSWRPHRRAAVDGGAGNGTLRRPGAFQYLPQGAAD